MAEQIQAPLSILRRKQVEARTGLARSTIYGMVAEGKFPRPISLGPRAVGWIEADVVRWLQERIAASATEARP